MPPGPEARYEQTKAISLAFFVTALQVLPPRQVAVLILRDVLGFHASEVAGMLEVTVESVNSALKRARASLDQRLPPAAGREPAPASGSPAEDAIVAKFARAWESADLDALVALLTDDVFIAMPPVPFGYEGRDAVTRYCASLFAAGRRFEPRPGASQRPARIRGLPALPGRHPPRDRLLRAHPCRRPDLRHDPLRGQRAAVVRAAAITPEPVAGLRAVKVSSRENTPWRICHCGSAECGRPGMRVGTSTGPTFDPADSTRAPGRFWPKPTLRHAPEWTAA